MVYSRASLESMKMSQLREIGRPLGASDTSKSELIDEILVKQPREKGLTETEKLIRDIKRYKGSAVDTYALRGNILDCLERLRKFEIGGD